MREILTVLVNDRPSAIGMTDSADFIKGYEWCLASLREMLSGKRREKPEMTEEPTYGI